MIRDGNHIVIELIPAAPGTLRKYNPLIPAFARTCFTSGANIQDCFVYKYKFLYYQVQITLWLEK